MQVSSRLERPRGTVVCPGKPAPRPCARFLMLGPSPGWLDVRPGGAVGNRCGRFLFLRGGVFLDAAHSIIPETAAGFKFRHSLAADAAWS